MLPFLYVLIGLGLVPVGVRLEIDPSEGARIWLRVGFLRFAKPLKGMGLAKTLELSRIWQGQGLRVGAGALAKVLREHVMLERFWVQGRVGLENAAHTALLSGGLQVGLQLMGVWLAGGRKIVRVRVAPAYGQACFAWAVDIAASARVGMLVHGALSLAVMAGLRGLRERRVKGMDTAA